MLTFQRMNVPSLIQRTYGTSHLVQLPARRRIIGRKWVYKVKTGADSLVQRYKVRLVTQGCTQEFSTDYDETFCPVVQQESLHVVIVLSVQYGLQLHQMDVTTAFLNGTLEEEVLMRQPKSYEVKGKDRTTGMQAQKEHIYGLKYSSCCAGT